MEKYELPISTSYVPNWRVVDAVRRIFQNAVDNEIENSDNKMSWTFENNTLTISNKTSILEAHSLLLGESSKRDNKKITVYNYGAREIWNV